VAYLGFWEGRAKEGRFEAPEAPMGWSVGRGCPLPTEKEVWGGGCAPSPEILKQFLVQCVQKIFAFRPRGASPPPPKYAIVGYDDANPIQIRLELVF